MNTLLLLISLLEATHAYLSSNAAASQRVFGVQRASSVQSTTDAVKPAGLSSDEQEVNVDLLGNRASEWFMPRIGGLTASDIRNRNQAANEEARHSAASNILEVSSAKELDDFLQADDDRLTLLFFHANYCKTCQRFKLRYDKIASLYADEIRMASLEHTAHSELFDSMDVEVFPTVQFYKRGKKVNEVTIPPEKFDQAQRMVEEYLEEERLEDELELASTLLEGKKLLDSVLNDPSLLK